MTLSDSEKLLINAASRARTHPAYLAWVLGRYLELENVSEDTLAQSLGVSILDLCRLGLCLRPRTDHLADDITQISTRFNADLGALAGIVRLVESVEVIATERTATIAPETGLLMAARTRKKKQKRQDTEGQNGDQSKS
jgi:hypothetical protein